MGKKKANVAPEEENGEMDMSPMIDMVFLLLIFFVVNATAITVKKDKNIQMPTASSSGEVKSANGCIVVNVYGEGAGLYLRGDQQALFKGSREVIRVAAECGVVKVIFAVLPAKNSSPATKAE